MPQMHKYSLVTDVYKRQVLNSVALGCATVTLAGVGVTAVAVAALCCVGVRHGSSLPFLSGNPLFVVRGFRSRAPFDW